MRIYWLWVALLDGFTRRQKLALLQHFSDPETLYLATDFSDCGELSPQQVQSLLDKNLKPAETLHHICMRKEIGLLTILDAAYPSRLRNIADPPLVLFYRGVLPDFEKQPTIAVVGTRKATAYGMGVARQFGTQLSACGGLVVSGGAAGIDTMALQGALDADGQTVAVLGCGPDVVYPRTNRRLFSRVEENGCILSEYLPGTQPKPWQFPERNRIISGISNGVLVIEAPQRSGALITARDALEQGRDVYVVPANIDMPSCEGSNALLSEGGAAVFTGWDILQQYAPQYPDVVQRRTTQSNGAPARVAQTVLLPGSDKKDIDNPVSNSYSVKIDNDPSLTAEENRVLSCLDNTQKPLDELIAQLGMPPGEVLTVLTKLSLKGLVINHPGRLVSARKQ